MQVDDPENLVKASKQQIDALNALETIITSLSDDPYQYEKHIEYINTLKAAGMDDEVPAARIHMHNFFPLTLNIYNEWIDDAIVKATTSTSKANVIKVFEMAVDEFLSVELWKRYTEFVMSLHKTSPDEYTRSFVERTFERALAAVGYHLTQSHIVWNAYRDFEMEELEISADSIQIERIRKMYIDRLEIPHSGIDDTFSSYSSFVTKYANQKYEEYMLSANSIYSASQTRTFELERLETQLADQGYTLEMWNDYINAELSRKKPSVPYVRTLYERALAMHYFLPSLWEDYIAYMLKMVSIQLVFDVAKRATRNCPWSGDTWAVHMRLLERAGREAEVKSLFEKALQIPLLTSQIGELVQTVCAYADFVRRKIDWSSNPPKETIETLRQVLMSGMDTVKDGDPYFRLERYLISIETYQLQEIDNARRIWERLTKTHSGSSEMWIQYASWERSIGFSPNKARSIYKMAAGRKTEWPERILGAWLAFEHESGSLQDYEYAFLRIRRETLLISQRRAKEAAAVATMDTTIMNTSVADESQIQGKSVQENHKKRKLDDDRQSTSNKNGKRNEIVRDREHTTVNMSHLPQDVNEDDIKAFFKECGSIREVNIHHHHDRVFAVVEFTDRDGALTAATRDKKKLKNKKVSVFLGMGTTLYVTNYPESMGTDTPMHKIFDKYGKIMEIRFPSKKLVATRRFCYIQFETPESAQKALEVDGMYMDELRVSVHISDPSKRKKRTDINRPKSNLKDEGAGLRSFVPNSLTSRPATKQHARLGIRVSNPKPGIKNDTSANDRVDSKQYSGTTQATKKGNDDFRRMFLNGKS